MAEKSFWSEKKDKEWVSNFFFYYSKHLIVGLLILIIIIYGCVSCINKVEYDFEMYYLSDKGFEPTVFENVETVISGVADDVDGKDGVVVSFLKYVVPSGENITTETDAALNTKVHLELAEGNGYLYIMNENWAQFCMNNEILEDISHYTDDSEACYYTEVTDNELLNSLGFKDNGKLYMGLRILNENRKDEEIEVKKHNNAKKVLQYIIENK